jgi:hypothetical protein
MTAKDKLRQTVDRLTEAEAADMRDFLARRRGARDALGEFLDQAPVDDEPVTNEEERAVQQARDEIERGETISLEQARTELR